MNYIWVFDSVPLVKLSLLCQYLAVLVTLGLQCSLQSEPLCFGMFFKDCLSSLVFLFFHMRLSTVLLRSVNNCVGSLLGITLNLEMVFGRMASFTM